MAIAIVSRRTSRSPSEAAYSGDASDIKLDYIEASGGIVMSETMDSELAQGRWHVFIMDVAVGAALNQFRRLPFC